MLHYYRPTVHDAGLFEAVAQRAEHSDLQPKDHSIADSFLRHANMTIGYLSRLIPEWCGGDQNTVSAIKMW